MFRSPPKAAVIIASKGRPVALAEIAKDLRQQTVPATTILFSVTEPLDLPDLDWEALEIRVLIGEPGLCRQRNAAMEELPADTELVAFFDDDYVPEQRAIEKFVAFAESHPEILGFDGTLLADGINGPGIGWEDAHRLIGEFEAKPQPALSLAACEGLYGCNMVYRCSAIRGLRFDENLPLYGWQEDIDFSAQVARRGTISKTNVFAGVHRGVKGGRSSGRRLGYSQIANPIYLMRKGTMLSAYARRLMSRNFVANHVKLINPEPWVDRRGRCVGNWLAIVDWVRGRLHPNRITEL